MASPFAPPFRDYDTAEKFLGNREYRRVSNNSIINRLSDNVISLRLHNTDIVDYHKNGAVYINTGGYLTNTTKRYINGAVRAHVVQKNFSWFVDGKPWDGSRMKIQ